jgi:hypothetical protein
MLFLSPPIPSLMAWSAAARVLLAAIALAPLWGAVGWALGWW